MLWDLYSKLPFVPGLDLGRTGEERRERRREGGIDRERQRGEKENQREGI